MANTVFTHEYPDGQRLEIIQGDLTDESVDAIVNAANSQLDHGGGVAAAIVRKGGSIIQTESTEWVRQNGPVTHETPAHTSAGDLPAQYVIHTVGPQWGEGDEDHKLEGAIRGALGKAEMLRLESVALPAISTGIFGFPVDRAALIFKQTLDAYYIRNPESRLRLVRIVLNDEETAQAFLKAFVYEKNEEAGLEDGE